MAWNSIWTVAVKSPHALVSGAFELIDHQDDGRLIAAARSLVGVKLRPSERSPVGAGPIWKLNGLHRQSRGRFAPADRPDASLGRLEAIPNGHRRDQIHCDASTARSTT